MAVSLAAPSGSVPSGAAKPFVVQLPGHVTKAIADHAVRALRAVRARLTFLDVSGQGAAILQRFRPYGTAPRQGSDKWVIPTAGANSQGIRVRRSRLK